MKQQSLVKEKIVYVAKKQKQETKQLIKEYCSVSDFLQNINENINKRELWLDKLKFKPQSPTFDSEIKTCEKTLGIFESQEEFIIELQRVHDIYKKHIMNVPSSQRNVVLLALFTNKSREYLSGIFDAAVTPPSVRKEKIKAMVFNNQIIKLLDFDEVECTELKLRTWDAKYKEGLKSFQQIHEFLDDFFASELELGSMIEQRYKYQ